MLPRSEGEYVTPQKKYTESLANRGEVGHVPEGGGRRFIPDPSGVTTSAVFYGDPTNSGNITFDPGGMYTMNWSSTV